MKKKHNSVLMENEHLKKIGKSLVEKIKNLKAREIAVCADLVLENQIIFWFFCKNIII